MEIFLYKNYGIVLYDLSKGVSPPSSCRSSWGSCTGGGGRGRLKRMVFVRQADTGMAGGGGDCQLYDCQNKNTLNGAGG
jgi:hypothetical protein